MAIPSGSIPATNTLVNNGNVRNRAFSAAVLEAFRLNTVLGNSCNRRYEAIMQNAAAAQIPFYTNVPTVSTMTLSDDFEAPSAGPTINSKILSWGDNKIIDSIIHQNEISDMSVPLLANEAVRIGQAIALYLDDKIASTWDGTTLTAVKDDFTNNADHDAVVGGANELYDYSTGDSTGSAKNDDGVFDELRRMRLLLTQRNQARSTSANPRTWSVILPPHLFENLMRSIENKDAQLLKIEYLEGRERTRLFGIFDLIESNNLNKKAISSKDHWPVYFLTNDATTLGVRNSITQVISPQNNQLGPGWYFRNYWQEYVAVIDSRFMYRSYFREQA